MDRSKPSSASRGNTQAPLSGRLALGAAIFVAGFAAPVLVPLVAASELPGQWKAALSGFLMVGIPELSMLVAVAIMGKAGFQYITGGIKRRLARFFAEHGPAERVSRARYSVGLTMFLVPIAFGWAVPYVEGHIPGYAGNRLVFALAGDFVLLCSLFMLGGEFWDKLRSLFVHGARVEFPAAR